MFGITGTEAALFIGTLLSALILGLLGKKAGDHAKKVTPPDPVTSGISAGFVDRDMMSRLTVGVERIAGTMDAYVKNQADETESRMQDAILRIQESQDRLVSAVLEKNDAAALQKKRDDDERAERTASRAERAIDRQVTRVESHIKKPRP